MTFSWRSYIDALSANVQRVYSKTQNSIVPQKVFFLVEFRPHPSVFLEPTHQTWRLVRGGASIRNFETGERLEAICV